MAALPGDAPRTGVRSSSALASSNSTQLTNPSLLDLEGAQPRSSPSARTAQPNGTRAGTKFSIEHWNHYSMVLIDPEYPRTSNMVEGFHLLFKCKVNRPKPSVQEYRDQLVTTDYHLDRLAAGTTPAKGRKTSNHILYDICKDFDTHDTVLGYMFKVAEYFGHQLLI
jgi:hypothetical protein